MHHFVTRLSEVPRLSEFWQPLHFQLCASFHGKFVRVAKVARGLTTFYYVHLKFLRSLSDMGWRVKKSKAAMNDHEYRMHKLNSFD